MQTAANMMMLAQALLQANQTFMSISASISAARTAVMGLVTAFAGTAAISAGISQMGMAVSAGMTLVVASMTAGMMQVSMNVQMGMMQSQAAMTSGMAVIVSVTISGITTMVAVFQSGGAQIVAIARSTASGITAAFTSINLYSAGVNMMAGLQAGISARGASVIATARSIASQAAAAVNSALQIRSPSRLMMKSGQYLDEGLAVGMQKNSGMVQTAAVASLAKPVMDTGRAVQSIQMPETVTARSAVIGETVGTLAGSTPGNRGRQPEGGQGPTFVFSPTYHFEGEAPSKEDIVEANRMSQKEFEKMMKEYLRKNKRVSFA